nr:hypothetical protein MACL_00002847 [Theileria orientalis]
MHPKSLVFTKRTETLVLQFKGLDMSFAKNDQGQWEYTETATSASEADTLSESGYTSLPEEYESYASTESEDGKSVMEVPHTRVIPLSSSSTQDKSLKPIPSDTGKTMGVSGNEFSLGKTGASTTQPRVRLFKVNPSDLSNLLSLSTNEFSSITSGSVVKYQIANGVNCAQLMFDNDLLWVHDSSQYKGRYPKSVYHNTVTDVLVLRMLGVDITFEKNDQETLVLQFKGLDMSFAKNDQGQWEYTETATSASEADTLSESGYTSLPEEYESYASTESEDGKSVVEDPHTRLIPMPSSASQQDKSLKPIPSDTGKTMGVNGNGFSLGKTEYVPS